MKNRCLLMGILVTVLLSTLTLSLFATASYGAERKLVMIGWGGSWDEGIKKAFTEPFTKETGIEVEFTGPLDWGKVKAMVQSGNVEWDIGMAGMFMIYAAMKAEILAPIDYSIVDKNQFYARTIREYSCGGDVESVNIGYRSDTYKENNIGGWKDFWDVKGIPGPRSLPNNVNHVMIAAALADGITPDKLYPLDEDRIFASLDRIKPYIPVWWTSGSQSQSLIKNKEVDMVATWNGRIVDLIFRGDPVGMSWSQALSFESGWFVVKNSPMKKEAMMLIDFAGRAKNQAIYSERTYYGPTNPEALKYIDPKIVKWMPNHPDNYKKCVDYDQGYEYWLENRDRLVEKFNSWLIK